MVAFQEPRKFENIVKHYALGSELRQPTKGSTIPLEWVAALRQVYEWEPEILFPGHGPPIIGADRVRQALQDTIQVLEEIVCQRCK